MYALRRPARGGDHRCVWCRRARGKNPPVLGEGTSERQRRVACRRPCDGSCSWLSQPADAVIVGVTLQLLISSAARSAEDEPSSATRLRPPNRLPPGRHGHQAPYGDAYSYVPPGGCGEPYEYIYYPSYGWTWVVAPWVWSFGPWPHFGSSVPGNSSMAASAFHGIRPAPFRSGVVVRSAPVGRAHGGHR
jgi:hypothetical protein